jgi:putative solute:sodium symporter small subunit
VQEGQHQRPLRRTTRLIWLLLPLWLVLMFMLPLFAATLNQTRVVGYPLGFYMAAQGTLILFAALAFWFCRRQDKLEKLVSRDEA